MKKIFNLLIGILLIFPLVSATDIAYILRDTNFADSEFIELIDELGYTYELIDDSRINRVDFSNYEMILIGDENILGVPVNDYKSLIVTPDYYEGWSFTIVTTAGNQPLKANNTEIDNPVSQGLEGVFDVYTQAKDNGVGIPMYSLYGRKYDAYRITSTINNLGEYVVATKNEPRRVFFGITETEFWTQESKELFKNSIEWIIKGEDKDKDGFFSDQDCDDENYEINPDAVETPYDYIDQDCDGKDLVDVDNDGYDAEIVGGSDCDDENYLINPGSSDVYKNCKNDAAIVEEINNIVFYETEVVEIEIIAVDPEGDYLEYFINDSRFSKDGNVFRWQTDYYDKGDYVFRILVSDGNLNSSLDVGIVVRATNQAPLCEEIPVLEWDEDTIGVFNLSEYCYDLDNDNIFFLFNSTSEDENITLEELETETGVVRFSSKANWSGEDWIKFKITDLKDEIITEEIILRVKQVNDAPIFNLSILDIEWQEDTNLIEEIDLRDYFYDIDSEIDFSVLGNSNINILIENGKVSFYPNKDWNGEEEVIFKANDLEFEVESNIVKLKVVDANEPPVFEDFFCEDEINEDETYNCELNASDFEGDLFEFEIVSEDNLDCEIRGNYLGYVSDLDYNGLGDCLIKVSDEYGYSEYLFEVDVLAVNDAPIIESYSPRGSVKLIEGDEELFEISASDVDSDFEVFWFLDGVLVDSEDSYIFSDLKGNYEVKVEVTDGELNESHVWDVFVGDISDFTCSEVEGYIISSNEVCMGEVLNVLDSNVNTCCTIKGSPKFADINRCDNFNENVSIKIKKPDEDEEFNLGEEVDVRIEVENKFDDDLDFEAELYLYDISEDKELEEYKDSVKVDEGDDENVDFEFSIPTNLDVSGDYALFFKVVEEDEEYCNEGYVRIEIEKEKEKAIIEEFLIISKEVFSGGYLEGEVEIKNIGREDLEDVYLIVENLKLGIREESEKFDIDEGEKERIFFDFKIPENLESKEYELKAKVFYDGEEDFVLENFLVISKKVFSQVETTQESISLKAVNNEVKQESTRGIEYLILIMIFFTGVGVLVVLFATKD